MWFGNFLNECLDVAQGEPVSRPARIICVAVVSLVFAMECMLQTDNLSKVYSAKTVWIM